MGVINVMLLSCEDTAECISTTDGRPSYLQDTELGDTVS